MIILVFLIGFDERLLVGAASTNRAARDAIHNHALNAFSFRAFSARNAQQLFLRQAVVFKDVLLQFHHDFLEGTHLQLVANDVDDVTSGHDSELGIECLQHLHIGVVHAIEQHWVDVLDKDVLFYHSFLF